MNFTAYLSMGSNTGDRHNYLIRARDRISEFARIERKSLIYKTEAWGEENQPEFLNQVIKVSTDLSPDNLLKRLQEIEQILGKKERYRWGPREIDIDILFYDEIVMKKHHLQIPHLEIQNRKFILRPMAEIAADHMHPVLKKSISDLLGTCTDQLKVSPL
ncbi:MAG: 2-amino-4-hydroxy-6-hydroxymethyldihydropteridine diphosphokinase [Chitinophagales bacterium]|nr:2-amino-4-hydroxy-6-hydroxymethyldihydropteridine diphosphokinase [Chitinophagales bacterium]